MITCKDCKIIFKIDQKHLNEHPGLCCDCFDETWGMKEKSRSYPRPKDEYVCALRVPFPDGTKCVGKGNTPEIAIENAKRAIREHIDLIRELI